MQTMHAGGQDEGEEEGGIGYEDWESDADDEICVKSLFDDTTFPSLAALMEHDQRVHGFSLPEAAKIVGMDDLYLIMLVNFVRRSVQTAQAAPTPIDAAFVAQLQREISVKAFLDEFDAYMLPVLADDAMLYLLRDELGGLDDDDEANPADFLAQLGGLGGHGGGLTEELAEIKAEMQQEVEKFRTLYAAQENMPVKEDTDTYYFDSYSHIGIHETMLRDRPRTSAYAAALQGMDLSGKVVLDVGCGTGILCMLAARAGAKKVIGVDCSGIIDVSRRVVAANGFADVITLVQGKVEDGLSLPADEVDVIVSEWMGYGLYYENMLASVIHARKEYLVPGGLMMPSHALLYVEAMGCDGDTDRVAWWGGVYGFDMSLCSELLTQEAQVQTLSAEDIVSSRALVHSLDCAVAEDDSLDFCAPFSLQITRAGAVKAFALSFDVDFRLPSSSVSSSVSSSFSSVPAAGASQCVTLSTAVQADTTHWKHTALWLQPPNVQVYKQGDVINGTIEYKRRVNPRCVQ